MKSKRARRTTSKLKPGPQASMAPSLPKSHLRRRAPPSIEPKDVSKTSFADLPAELRNIIYEYALTRSEGGPIYLAGGRTTGKDLALGLLAGCKAIYKEASGIFFAKATFRVDFGRVTRKAWKEMERTACWRSNSMEAYRRIYPAVTKALRILGAKNVARIRSWLFVYHDGSPSGPRDDCGIPIEGTLCFRLDLLPRAPFARLDYDRRYAHRGDAEEWKRGDAEEWKRGGLLHSAMCYIEQEVAFGPIRGLAIGDVLRFVEWLRQSCQDTFDEKGR